MPIWRFSQVTSTIDVARQLAVGIGPKGLLVVADEQTAGRGTRGRAWQSPPGSLSATFVSQGGPAKAGLALLIGIAAVDAIGDELAHAGAQGRPMLRWPNDVVFEMEGSVAKAAGCLAQLLPTSDGGFVLASVGVNVNNEPGALGDDLRTPATSLATVAGQPMDARSFAGRLADALAEAVSAELTPTLIARAEGMLASMGDVVAIRTEADIRRGILLGLAPDGGLRLGKEDDTEEIVRFSAELLEAATMKSTDNTS